MKGAGQWRFLMVGGPHHGTWMTFNRYALEDIYDNRYYYVRDPQPLTYESEERAFDVPPTTMYFPRTFDVVSRDPDNRGAYIRVLVALGVDYKRDGWMVSDAMRISLPEHPVHWGGVL